MDRVLFDFGFFQIKWYSFLILIGVITASFLIIKEAKSKKIDTDTIIDNHIYVFCYEDRLYCKYLSYNVNQIIVRSANKDYPTRFIEKENINDFRLCGEVCGHFRSYLR